MKFLKRLFAELPDERMVQLENRVGNELAFIMLMAVLISALVKSVIFQEPFVSYLPEVMMIFISATYIFVRSWQLGLPIIPDTKLRGTRSRIIVI